MRARDFDRKKFILEEWPAALESGEFKQARGTLKLGDRHCCLGVACELLSRKRLLPRIAWESEPDLPAKAVELLQIQGLGEYGGENGNSLALLNDRRVSFKKIAKTIRSIEKKNQWDVEEI